MVLFSQVINTHFHIETGKHNVALGGFEAKFLFPDIDFLDNFLFLIKQKCGGNDLVVRVVRLLDFGALTQRPTSNHIAFQLGLDKLRGFLGEHFGVRF